MTGILIENEEESDNAVDLGVGGRYSGVSVVVGGSFIVGGAIQRLEFGDYVFSY